MQVLETCAQRLGSCFPGDWWNRGSTAAPAPVSIYMRVHTDLLATAKTGIAQGAWSEKAAVTYIR